MTLTEIVQKVTGKPIGTYIDNGYYCITRAQATKLCGGKLPKPGYEKTMHLVDGKATPSFTTSTHEYIISETTVLCRTDIASGNHWSVRAFR